MSGAAIAAGGRLSLMLTELRLPTIKRLAADLCTQSDHEGWPGHRLLEALLEQEMAEREARRLDRHRAESALSPDKRLSSFDFGQPKTPGRKVCGRRGAAEAIAWRRMGSGDLLIRHLGEQAAGDLLEGALRHKAFDLLDLGRCQRALVRLVACPKYRAFSASRRTAKNVSQGIQIARRTSISRILPIARAGFSPFGQTSVQFMMVRQRKSL